MLKSLLGSLAVFFAFVSASNAQVCNSGFIRQGRFCVQLLSSTTKSYVEAQDRCRALNSDLLDLFLWDDCELISLQNWLSANGYTNGYVWVSKRFDFGLCLM